MTGRVKCPRCGQVSDAATGSVVACKGCGVKLRVKGQGTLSPRSPAPTPAPAPRSARPTTPPSVQAAAARRPPAPVPPADGLPAPPPAVPVPDVKAVRRRAKPRRLREEEIERRDMIYFVGGACAVVLLVIGGLAGWGYTRGWFSKGPKEKQLAAGKGGGARGKAVAGAAADDPSAAVDRLPVEAFICALGGAPPEREHRGVVRPPTEYAAHEMGWEMRPDPGPAPVPGPAASPPRTPLAVTPAALASGRPYALLPATAGEAARVLDLRSGKVTGSFAAPAPVNETTRLSPDGAHLATYLPARPVGSVEIWSVGETKATARVTPLEGLTWFDFTPDGRRLVAHCLRIRDQWVLAWDSQNGKSDGEWLLPQRTFPGGTAPSGPSRHFGAISAGGRYVAILAEGRVVVLSLTDGQVLGDVFYQQAGERWRWPWRSAGIGFSADGREIWGLFLDGGGEPSVGPPPSRARVCIWDIEHGDPKADVILPTSVVAGPVLPGPDANSFIVSRDFGWKEGSEPPAPSAVKGATTRGRRTSERPAAPLTNPLTAARAVPAGAGWVMDRRTGTIVYALPLAPIVRLADGQLAGFEPPAQEGVAASGPVAVCAGIDRTAYEAAAQQARAQASAETPGETPPNPGDRTGVVLQKAEAPAAWSVPRSTPPPVAELHASI